MAPKKAIGKKLKAKMPADAGVSDGEKEGRKLQSNLEILQNGVFDTADNNDSIKSKAPKRSSARARNVDPVSGMEAPSPRPVAKGRGKKKSNENEVIKNETSAKPPENHEVETAANELVNSKARGRSGVKKIEQKSKETLNVKHDKAVTSIDSVQEQYCEEKEESILPDKYANARGGRKKKTESVPETMEEMQKNQVEKIEKVSKKTSRNRRKTDEIISEIEPLKKRGRLVKKEKSVEKNNIEVTPADLDEANVSVKEQKKPKRSAIAIKAVNVETLDINGDTEEVVPKKRSRKASNVEKEILQEKSKRGRAKNLDKIKEEILECETQTLGKEIESLTNGQVKQEILEEPSSSNKSAKKLILTTALASKVETKTKGGRKRAAPSAKTKKSSKRTEDDDEGLDDGVDNTDITDEGHGSKTTGSKKKKSDSAPLNGTTTNYNKNDFDLPALGDGKVAEAPRFNLKISSWNVAGLRSWTKKDGLKFLDYEQPDIFCMQETKCTNDQLPEEVVRIPGYHPYWLCMPGGYAGVAIYSKIMPINVEYGIGNKAFDDCGRIITAEYEKFFLINVYVPNSGRKLVNLETRMKWEELFQQFVTNLDARKPVIICGDMNVSHQEHDLANPKTNTRNAGFTKEERDKMTELLALGYVDTFRHLYPERKGAYTFWTYMGSARSRNVGWRLDYFIVSERLIKRVVDNCIRSQCMGSDHCPITLFLKL